MTLAVVKQEVLFLRELKKKEEGRRKKEEGRRKKE